MEYNGAVIGYYRLDYIYILYVLSLTLSLALSLYLSTYIYIYIYVWGIYMTNNIAGLTSQNGGFLK